jgi:sulfite reductase (ferredoxin)
MSKRSVEEIKEGSHGLRGEIGQTLASDTARFSDDDATLLKFHGTYQQDDRDRRKGAVNGAKAWMFMVRTKMPGGELTAEQYLAHDRLAGTLGNSTLRLTTRQGIQLHGVLKGGLRETIAGIRATGLTTWGACGDVVRNMMAPAAAIADAVHREVHEFARALSERFFARSRAYSEIWVDGERVEIDEAPATPVEADPIYGELYLPRKFKIGIAIPPRNDVDVFSQDLGFVPHAPNGNIEGYTVLVGGGFGMTHGIQSTFPTLAKPLFYVRREDAVEAAVAIVTTQRDHGNRTDRKRARLKYLIEDRGLDWFRDEVKARLGGRETFAPKRLAFSTVADRLGWHEQGDGRWFHGIHIPGGRIVDSDAMRLRSAIRAVTERFGFPIRITPNTNLLFTNIESSQREALEQTLQEFSVVAADGLTALRRLAHACVALPTCGLALAESERVLPELLDGIDAVLHELGLGEEPILFRMTGCPNGCARPYNADFSLVGRAPGRYALFVGGSIAGDRLAGLEQKTVSTADVPAVIRGYLEEFVRNRWNHETFSTYWGRTHENGPSPHPEQFHLELAERAARAESRHAEVAVAD